MAAPSARHTTAQHPAFAARAHELVQCSRRLHAQGWLPATSGNLSARLDQQHALVTLSGLDKGELDEDSFLIMNLQGDVVAGDGRPSAEAGLHLALYRCNAGIGAIVHTHSPRATVLSLHRPNGVTLRNYEMLKAFAGVDTHATEMHIPVFANDQDIARLAGKVDAALATAPDTRAYLIAGHGCYTWGAGVADAVRHIEALEFLFECELLQPGMESQ